MKQIFREGNQARDWLAPGLKKLGYIDDISCIGQLRNETKQGIDYRLKENW